MESSTADNERSQPPRTYEHDYYADGGRPDPYERPQHYDRERYEGGAGYDRPRRRSRSPDYRSARQYSNDARPDESAREYDRYQDQPPHGSGPRCYERDHDRDLYQRPHRSRSPQWDRDSWRPDGEYGSSSRNQQRDPHRWDAARDRRDYDRLDPRYEHDRDDRDVPRRTPPPPLPPPPPRPRYVPAQLRLVKLVSDVLPPQQSVATVESEASSGSAGVEEGISVGRDRVFTRRLRLASMDVSKHHANIFRTAGTPTLLGGDGGWWIVDNGSSHGTFVLRAENRLDFFREQSEERIFQDVMTLQQITASHPPLSAYHRLSEPKAASRPYELRHQDLVRFGATVLEVHLHVAPPRGDHEDGAGDGIDYRAATCCEVCQIDFSGQNLIPLSAKEGGESASTSNSQSDLASASLGRSGDTSAASGTEANRSLTGDRKLDSEVEWKRQMKGLRANYLGGGAAKTKGRAAQEGSGGGVAAGSAPSASTVSWKKHLSTKKKRSNADDGVMVSISTAHLEQRHASKTATETPSTSLEPAKDEPMGGTAPDDDSTESSAAAATGPMSPPVAQYVDRAAQRRLHAHSIENTLPRNAVAELAGHAHRIDPQQALRLASAAVPLPRSAAAAAAAAELQGGAEPVVRASALRPLAETNRGFKLLSAMSGGGGGGDSTAEGDDGGLGVEGGDGAWTGREQDRLGQAEAGRRGDHEPIMARGTSGRAGLGSAKLRDVDEIAAAGESSSSYADHGRETMRRRWDQAR
ncbi:hypothetical protein OC846_004622 [Tilletia horrida]|uniref:FHA domain-containing protein n=1 Tax=Tilletia horrida TaxID=155126 RepID=A0AAN6GSA6_9BASI|nr:hypothetical protein OC846_004622 [Tilletia horrida]